LSATKRVIERRDKLRVSIPFHAKVKGTDQNGEDFLIETVLDNIGANGLYMRIAPQVAIGSDLSIQVCLSTAPLVSNMAARVAIEGTVLRTERKPGGAWGLAVGFGQLRFY
jgi:hypothetical protein